MLSVKKRRLKRRAIRIKAVKIQQNTS